MSEREIDNMRKIDATRIVALTGKYVSAAPLNMLLDILYFISRNGISRGGMVGDEQLWFAV